MRRAPARGILEARRVGVTWAQRGTPRTTRCPEASRGREVAELAERQPSKLHVAGSIPVSRSNTSGSVRSKRDAAWADPRVTSRCPGGLGRATRGQESRSGDRPVPVPSCMPGRSRITRALKSCSWPQQGTSLEGGVVDVHVVGGRVGHDGRHDGRGDGGAARRVRLVARTPRGALPRRRGSPAGRRGCGRR